MTPVGHIAITSLAYNNPIASLIWGFINHWIMDETCFEYKLKSLSAKHLIPYIAWQGSLIICFLWYTKYWWAILGLLPDMIEGIYILIKGIRVWNSGELLFWFHRPNNRKMWSKGFTMIMEFIFIGVAIYVYI